MNVPAEIILAKIQVIFGSALDDVIQRIQTEIARFAQVAAKIEVVYPTAKSPNGVNERKLGHLIPGCPKVQDLLFWAGLAAKEIERDVPNQQGKIRQRLEIIASQRLELRKQTALGEQHAQQMDARQRGIVAKNLFHLGERLAMDQQYAFDFTERGDGDAIQNIVAIFEENFRHADQRGIEFIALQHFRQFRWRGEDDFLFQPAR